MPVASRPAARDALPRCSHARHDANDPAAPPSSRRAHHHGGGRRSSSASSPSACSPSAASCCGPTARRTSRATSTPTPSASPRARPPSPPTTSTSTAAAPAGSRATTATATCASRSPRATTSRSSSASPAPRTSPLPARHGARHGDRLPLRSVPCRLPRRARLGPPAPAAPASKRIWAASAHGTGMQTVTWDVKHGDWSVVVMNADGSRGVDTGVSAGADFPILSALAWGSVGGGLVAARRRLPADRRGHHGAAPRSGPRARARLRRCGHEARDPSRRGAATRAPRRTSTCERARPRCAPGPCPPGVHDDDDVRGYFASHIVEALRAVGRRAGRRPRRDPRARRRLVVDQLYVEPGLTGRGIGSALLAVAKRERPQGLRLWAFRRTRARGASTSATASSRCGGPTGATTRSARRTSSTPTASRPRRSGRSPPPRDPARRGRARRSRGS